MFGWSLRPFWAEMPGFGPELGSVCPKFGFWRLSLFVGHLDHVLLHESCIGVAIAVVLS